MNDLSPNNPPLFSVVIPAYNVGNYIGETINSVLAQEWQDYEIIVVNDGSTDNTRDILDKQTDPRIKIIHQSNGGVSKARNRGIEESAGKYIALLDGDDVWLPHHLRLAAAFFKTHPDIHWYASGCADSTDIERDMRQNTAGEHEAKFRLVHYFDSKSRSFAICSTVIERHTVPNGIFPEGVRYGEDLVGLARIASQNPVMGFISTITVLYRRRENSATTVSIDLKDKVKMDAIIFRYFKDIPLHQSCAPEAADYYRQESLGFWANRIMNSKQESWLPYIWERKSMTGLLPCLWISLFCLFSCVLAFVFGKPVVYWQSFRKTISNRRNNTEQCFISQSSTKKPPQGEIHGSLTRTRT